MPIQRQGVEPCTVSHVQGTLERKDSSIIQIIVSLFSETLAEFYYEFLHRIRFEEGEENRFDDSNHEITGAV